MILVIVLLSIPAVADTVHLKSAESVRQVKILDFKDARLEAVDRTTGQRKVVPFADIAAVKVDGRPDLNEAETQLALRRNDQAMEAYRKLQKSTATAGGWMRIWVRVRLLNLYAARGEPDRVVETFAELAKLIPDWVIQVSPTARDLKGPEADLAKAARRLAEIRNETKSDRVRQAMTKFLPRLGQDKPLPPPKDPKVASLDEKGLEQFDQPGVWLDTWAPGRLKAGQTDAVIRAAQRLYPLSLRRNLPVLMYWHGRALQAKGEHDSAALTLMQMVIEFPAGPYAPGGLFYAGQAASEAGRIEYARKLWRELIDAYSNSNDFQVIQLVEQARDLLQDKE